MRRDASYGTLLWVSAYYCGMKMQQPCRQYSVEAQRLVASQALAPLSQVLIGPGGGGVPMSMGLPMSSVVEPMSPVGVPMSA